MSVNLNKQRVKKKNYFNLVSDKKNSAEKKKMSMVTGFGFNSYLKILRWASGGQSCSRLIIMRRRND